MVTSVNIPHLILRTESGDRYLPLADSNSWTFGRDDNNHFVLSDRWISRNHAMLQFTDTGDFYLIDLGSRNGSFVNGRRVSIPVTIHNGDLITFGQTELQFHCSSSATDEVTPEEPGKEMQTSVLHLRRLISVMVVDIRDFTVLTQQLDEKILSEVIGSWFREAGNIIRENGSWVDKYIGDAVMAIWFHGSEVVNYDEIVHLLQALNRLHKMTIALNKKYPLPFPLRIGAGINTGYAMVGNTGSGDRPDYTAIGDTVNAAFRLETSTKEIALDIAMGESTYNNLLSVAAKPINFQQHTVHLKGYESPTVTYAGSFADLDTFLHDG